MPLDDGDSDDGNNDDVGGDGDGNDGDDDIEHVHDDGEDGRRPELNDRAADLPGLNEGRQIRDELVRTHFSG